LGCEDRAMFHGYVNSPELAEIYASSSFGVFPTSADAMPTLALLECMAHGLPPIVSRVPGANWVIREGENGFLFEPGDAEDLRRQLEVVSVDSTTREKAGAAARRDVEETFTWEKAAEKVEKAYQETIRGRRT